MRMRNALWVIGAVTMGCAAGPPPNAPAVKTANASVDEHGVVFVSVSFDKPGTIDHIASADVDGATLLSQTHGSPISIQLRPKAPNVSVQITSRGDASGDRHTVLEMTVPAAATSSFPVRVE